MTHTPGPWRWEWNAECNRGYILYEPRPGQAYAIAKSGRYRSQEQWTNDARLIAAAPDLLAALQAVHAELDSRRGKSREPRLMLLLCQAHAAITKATGE